MLLSAFDIEIVMEIKTLIDADMRVHHSIGYLAEKAGMSEYRLKTAFKQQVKTTLYGYLRKKRMMLAASLLEAGGKTLKDISKLTGFRHYGNFTRAFKEQYGVTPGLYRSNYKQTTG
jgi:AraC-like DNA-binding protein